MNGATHCTVIKYSVGTIQCCSDSAKIKNWDTRREKKSFIKHVPWLFLLCLPTLNSTLIPNSFLQFDAGSTMKFIIVR